MNVSEEQAEALNRLFDELQGQEPTGGSAHLDLKTARVVHELHRLVMRTWTRSGFVHQLERSLEARREARFVTPMRVESNELPDPGVARSDSVGQFSIRLPGVVPIRPLHTAAIAVLVIALVAILSVVPRNVGSRAVAGQPSSVTPHL